MVQDEASCALQEPSGTHTVAKHPENARAFAVGYGVEALKNASDVAVVLLRHGMAVPLSICLQFAGNARERYLKSGGGNQVSSSSLKPNAGPKEKKILHMGTSGRALQHSCVAAETTTRFACQEVTHTLQIPQTVRAMASWITHQHCLEKHLAHEVCPDAIRRIQSVHCNVLEESRQPLRGAWAHVR